MANYSIINKDTVIVINDSTGKRVDQFTKTGTTIQLKGQEFSFVNDGKASEPFSFSDIASPITNDITTLVNILEGYLKESVNTSLQLPADGLYTKGKIITRSATLTLSGTANYIGANKVLNGAGADKKNLVFSSVTDEPGGQLYITRVLATFVDTSANINNVGLRMQVFNINPVTRDDNTPWQFQSGYQNYVDVDGMSYPGAGTVSYGVNNDARSSVVCVTSGTDLFVQPITTTAYNRTVGGILYVEMDFAKA